MRLFRAHPPSIAILRLDGAIGMGRAGLSYATLARSIERAFALPKLQAVALVVNSPGGSPVQSALIARRIRDRADETRVPVLAFVEDVAASGGYWLACAADEIWADPSSIVGSIGVVSAGFGFQDLIARHGIERRVHTSGERKAILDPFRPEQPEDVAKLEALQRDIHAQFIAHVRARRAGKLAADDATLFSGEFWTGETGRALGLVDSIGHCEPALRARFGEKVKLVPVVRETGWLRRKLGIDAAVERATRALVEATAAAGEDRLLRQRYGL